MSSKLRAEDHSGNLGSDGQPSLLYACLSGISAGPSARRTQNRLAQREFRQRKLAYVKELEAKVEFLGTSTNDQLETLKFLVKGQSERSRLMLLC